VYAVVPSPTVPLCGVKAGLRQALTLPVGAEHTERRQMRVFGLLLSLKQEDSRVARALATDVPAQVKLKAENLLETRVVAACALRRFTLRVWLRCVNAKSGCLPLKPHTNFRRDHPHEKSTISDLTRSKK